MRFIIVILVLIKTSLAGENKYDLYLFLFQLSIVRCNTNPCELGGDFTAPSYNCIQLPNDLNNVICTCPNGQGRENAPCREK